MAALSLVLAPVAHAQTADQTTNTKKLNSVDSPNNNSTTTGSPSTTPSPDAANSKDTTTALDKNPGMAPTGSAAESATKSPNDADATEKTASTHTSGNSDDSKPMTDQQFLLKAAQGGMTEVELGKLAQEKASAPDVKEFGSHMVMDHSKADETLKSLAEKKGVMVPTTLDAKHQAMVDHFQHLSGPAFDKAYVRAMVRDHEKTAADFREASTTSQDPDVKSFATDNLKVIETHLSDIKSIQSSMK